MDETKRCPMCAETIQAAALKCKHCGSVLGGPVLAGPGVARVKIKGSPKGVCEDIGLDWKSQHTKLSTVGWATMVILTAVANDSKEREVSCIDPDTLLMWLATIHPSKVKADRRPALIAYQKHVKKVIADYFREQAPQPAPPRSLSDERMDALGRYLKHRFNALEAQNTRLQVRLTELQREVADLRPERDPDAPWDQVLSGEIFIRPSGRRSKRGG